LLCIPSPPAPEVNASPALSPPPAHDSRSGWFAIPSRWCSFPRLSAGLSRRFQAVPFLSNSGSVPEPPEPPLMGRYPQRLAVLGGHNQAKVVALLRADPSGNVGARHAVPAAPLRPAAQCVSPKMNSIGLTPAGLRQQHSCRRNSDAGNSQDLTPHSVYPGSP